MFKVSEARLRLIVSREKERFSNDGDGLSKALYLYIMTHSHVAVLLPVRAAPNVFKYYEKRRLEQCSRAFQIVAKLPCLSKSHKINRLDLGSAFVLFRKKHQIQIQPHKRRAALSNFSH